MSNDLERILNEIKALTPGETVQLRQKVYELLAAIMALLLRKVDELLADQRESAKLIISRETFTMQLIRREVDELLAAQPENVEQSLNQSLFEAGLLSEIKTPNRDAESFRAYQPVAVKGKPVSETIIEERR